MSTLIPTSALGTAGVWGLLLAIVVAMVKVWPALKKLKTDEDASLRETLLARVESLEARLDTINAQHAAERELHAAELALVRHRMSNESASMDALVGMLETNPNIPPETIKRITDSRAAASTAFANEMNAITTARIALAKASIAAVKEDKGP